MKTQNVLQRMRERMKRYRKEAKTNVELSKARSNQ